MKEFRKRNTYFLLLFCGISISISLLFSSIIIGIIDAFIFLLISATWLYYYDKKKQKMEKRKAQLEFLLSFRNGVYDQKGSKQSYEEAGHFLKGYQETIPFEDLIQDPSARKMPDDYQEYFEERMKFERKGEIHLPDYRPLLEKIEEHTTLIEKRNHSDKRDFLFSLLLLRSMEFGMSILRIVSQSVSNRLSTIPMTIVLSIFPILSISLTMVLLFMGAKDEHI